MGKYLIAFLAANLLMLSSSQPSQALSLKPVKASKKLLQMALSASKTCAKSPIKSLRVIGRTAGVCSIAAGTFIEKYHVNTLVSFAGNTMLTARGANIIK